MPVGLDKEHIKDASASEDRQLVIFKIAGEEFGVDINEVKEIIRWEEVTRIPNTESYIKGVINLRGSIVVVNDLAMKLGLPSKTVDDDTRILVVEVNGNIIGMVVDSATEVLRLEGKKVQDAPDMITSGIDNNYIEGVGVLDEKRLLTLLDLTKVMASTDYEKILQVQQSAIQHFDEIKDENSEGGSDNETEKQTDTTETKPLPEKTGSERKVKSKVKKTQTKRRKNGS
jgi:purine-binding chemotaxis protein CheW